MRIGIIPSAPPPIPVVFSVEKNCVFIQLMIHILPKMKRSNVSKPLWMMLVVPIPLWNPATNVLKPIWLKPMKRSNVSEPLWMILVVPIPLWNPAANVLKPSWLKPIPKRLKT